MATSNTASRSKSASTRKPKARAGSRTGKAAKVPMDRLREFVRTKGHEFLKDPNITSIGIGRKNGDGPISLQFTVEKKIADKVEIEKLGSVTIPKSISVFGVDVPTDVLERAYVPSWKLVAAETLGERRMRVDPIRPGISIAHVKETAGTVGLIVYDRETGAPCVLSNWHVLNGPDGKVGDTIVQPGPFDDNNTAGNFCGNLLRSHLGAAGDCAIARIRTREFDAKVYDLDVAPTKMANVDIDDELVKSGRTTGVTYGVVRRIDVLTKIDYGGSAGVVAIGGFEIGVLKKRKPRDGEISRPGDSGSAWLVADGKKATDVFAGLHFAGEAASSPDEHALACYPLSVQKKLDFVLAPPKQTVLKGDDLDAVVPRSGYDADFLGSHVPLPRMTLSIKRDAVNFGRAQMIPYTHFSVCLSAARRMPRFVAWNIDGARRVSLGRHDFKIDPRIDPKFQAGDELYADNPLDRGHVAMRADLAWGPVAEARQANRDSFFFTNIAPQHERFNQSSRQGLWGQLENHVLQQVDAKDIRVSAMGGPIFGTDDAEYRGFRLPRQFWKLVAYLGADGRLRVAVFMLSQTDLLHDLEVLDFDPFRIHQISVAELSSRSGLDFSAFTPADVIRRPELAVLQQRAEGLHDTGVAAHEIFSEEDIVI